LTGKLNSKNNYDAIIRNYKSRTRNLPVLEGRELPLTDFAHMDDATFKAFRDHFYHSFTESQACENPFQLIRASREIPALTVYRQGTSKQGNSKEDEQEPKKSGKTKGKKLKSVEVVNGGDKVRASFFFMPF
jgi:hypothetical protein